MTHLAKAMALVLALALLSGCNSVPVRDTAEPDKLIVYEDGTMEYRDRRMPVEDVVIYADGFGGERAAVRVRVEPMRPDFFRDTIIVERR